MYRTNEDLLGNTEYTEAQRLPGASTIEWWDKAGNRHIRYHDTDVVTYMVGGRIVLNSGGFRSQTTKLRMNEQLVYSVEYCVFQRNYNWFVKPLGINTEEYPFQDGMWFTREIITPGGLFTKVHYPKGTTT